MCKLRRGFLVPVLSKEGKPLMPCSVKRARRFLEKGEAKAIWKNQIFCIQLLKDSSGDNLQGVAVGIDPGSKKEGITVGTKKSVVLNITAEAVTNVKDSVESRKILRKSRRNRKTPYRECRFNRDIGGIHPSTKARWDSKLRILDLIRKIVPVSIVNVEDISAVTKKGAKKWNKSFSPLEVGKKWFEDEIKFRNLDLIITKGFATKTHRNIRGFKKTSKKMDNVWEAHNVDSHSLVEIALNCEIEPFKGLYTFENFKFSRRQLHVQNAKNGIRKQYGGTVSLGIPRGSLVRHGKFGVCYIGGSSKGRISLHCLGGKRLTQSAKKQDLTILSINKWRTQFLSDLKDGVSLREKKDELPFSFIFEIAGEF